MSTKARYNAGVQTFYDSATFETTGVMSPVLFYDDFLGADTVVPAAGSAESGMDWVKKIVGAAPPTVAGVSSAIGGQLACTLTSTSEKQDAVLYWGDNKGLDATKGLVFETRVKLSVLPSASGVQAVWGIASDWIDGPNNNTCYLTFGATANGSVLIRAYDGVTTTSAASGVTLTTADWAIFRIDATDVTDVKFFINGAQVSTTGQVNFAATGTLAVLQPYLGCYKPSGTGVATLTADYVKAWANRS
ncbi:hypothetical protein E6C67_08390 [Azospirillum sp. TSA2s]|uniref:hypothetical protein n=1 Tax=Azospirillum sp. TSA2s TaxID=709810 RepID=UPI0010AA5EF2|nr:hypothetical protein [Azospirillum sp. TSA2s]QCG93957.1 hypothetical protein E6C67_08390 [Azospirillum sp. TSA2s]